MAKHGRRFHDAAAALAAVYGEGPAPHDPELLIFRLFPLFDAEHRVRLAAALAEASGAAPAETTDTLPRTAA
jgi:hypothetical protein